MHSSFDMSFQVVHIFQLRSSSMAKRKKKTDLERKEIDDGKYTERRIETRKEVASIH